MRRFTILLFLGWASVSANGAGVEWFTDAQAAQAKAKQENKFVLLDFTGSDWCGWCMKLKREVFDQPEFADFAQANLVMVEVDFPHGKQLDAAQTQANGQLAKTYQITGYPTIIVLDPDGQMAGRAGYVPGGPPAFDAKLEQILRPSRKDAKAAPEIAAEPPRKPVVFAPIPPAAPIHYGPLALKGISGTKDRRLVMINNANLMTGESAKVRVQDRDVLVCCKEIRENSVLITADDKPMELKLGQR